MAKDWVPAKDQVTTTSPFFFPFRLLSIKEFSLRRDEQIQLERGTDFFPLFLLWLQFS